MERTEAPAISRFCTFAIAPMLISLQHQFAFLCNRKCASISVEAMLRKHSDVSIAGPPDLRHSNYRHYARYFAPWLEASVGRTDIETICLVREPLSWLYSWYRFRSATGSFGRAGGLPAGGFRAVRPGQEIARRTTIGRAG